MYNNKHSCNNNIIDKYYNQFDTNEINFKNDINKQKNTTNFTYLNIDYGNY